MTPEQLAKGGSEHAHQTALFAWCGMAALHGPAAADDPLCYAKGGREYATATYGTDNAVSILDELYAIPNGGERNKAVAGKLKAEGVKAGTPDTHLPASFGGYHSLYIEMKKPGDKKGKLNDAQKDRFPRLQALGNKVVVCYTWREALTALCNYIYGRV